MLKSTVALGIIWMLTVTGLSPAFAGDNYSATKSPEEQRFEAAQQGQQRSQVRSYILTAKRLVERSWHEHSKNGLAITKVKMTINTNGKVIDCTVLLPSKSPSQDQSIKQYLNTVAFPRLPASLEKVSMFLTLMADDIMNMVEFTDSPEANS